jgi:uncharacterized membrane protein
MRECGMAILLFVTGVAHFLFPKSLDAIVPGFLPGDPRFWVYLSGLAEIVIASILLAPLRIVLWRIPLRLFGAYGALLLFVAVFPANINMAIQWHDRVMPYPLFAYARLPLQLGLFYWAIAIAKNIKRLKKS